MVRSARTIDYTLYKSRLLNLVRHTNRYRVCEYETGQFEVRDDRYLLDHLLALSEIRHASGDPVEFEDLLESLSSGPALTGEDSVMLDWLTAMADAVDPEGQDSVINGIFEGAILFKGDPDKVESFIRDGLELD